MKRIKNIIKLFFIGLVLFHLVSPQKSLAQNKIFPEFYNGSDSIIVHDFELLRNRPDSVSRKTFCIYPLALSQYNFTDDFILDASFSYDLNKNLTLSGETFLAYWLGGPYGNAYSYPYINTAQIGLGATYYFYNKANLAKINAYVETSPGNSVLARFDGKHGQKFGIKATVNLLNTTVTNSQIGFVGYDVNDPSMKKVDFGTSPYYYNAIYGDPFTNSLVGYFSIGAVYERVKDVAVVADKYRKRDISSKYRFYADLLVAPYVKYANIFFPQADSFPQKTYNVDKYTPKQRFGFRIGWDFFSLQKIGLSGGTEGGYMPNGGIYYILKIGVALSTKRIKFNGL